LAEKKLKTSVYHVVQNILIHRTILAWIASVTDGQTDGQIDRITIAIARVIGHALKINTNEVKKSTDNKCIQNHL